MITEVRVQRGGNVLKASTVARRLDEADPGTWDHDHPLRWSCPVLAGMWGEHIKFTLGKGYVVSLVTHGE